MKMILSGFSGSRRREEADFQSRFTRVSSLLRRRLGVILLILVCVLLWGPTSVQAIGTVVSWGGAQPNGASGLNNVAAVSASVDHTLALKSDGTVLAWGSNMNGECNVTAG